MLLQQDDGGNYVVSGRTGSAILLAMIGAWMQGNAVTSLNSVTSLNPRIFFINRFFFPDHSATAQLVSDLAFDLAGRGWDVNILTSAGCYDQTDTQLPAHEIVHGVKIHRVAKTRFGRRSIAGRATDYLTMYWAFSSALLTRARRGDIVIAKTDPPLLSVAIAFVARLRHLQLINWLQDLYPEVAERLGMRLLSGPVGFVLGKLRDNSLRAAHANVVIGDRMAEELRKRDDTRIRVVTIPNWCDDVAISPQGARPNRFRSEWNLEDKFVVGYSGNLGRAHEFDTVLSAAEILRGTPDIVFLFIGAGHLTPSLKREVSKRGLDESFQFRPYQGAADLTQSLSLPDVHWISLIPALEGFIVPSKFYAIAAVARATIVVTADDGEIARWVRKFDAGVVSPPGDGKAFAAAVIKLRDDPARLTQMGQNARAMLDQEFRGQYSRDKWQKLISSC